MSDPILPGATLGILGGGHAGRMTALAARALGYHVHALDADPASSSDGVADRAVRAAPNDLAAVVDASRACDVATGVVEQLDPAALWRAAAVAPVRPGPGVAALTRDRNAEHRWLSDRGVLVAPWRTASTPEELAAAVAALGGPCWVKSCVRQSDEARPVRVVAPEDARTAWSALGGRPCVAERELDVDLELSVLVARTPRGEVAVYPPALSARREGELLWTVLPAPVPAPMAGKAEQLAAFVARKLKVEGLVTVEMFLLRDGRLVVNELVAGPHATYVGAELACATSQWEQLVRAVCDLPLGETRVVRPVASAVIWGDSWSATGAAPAFDRALRAPGVTLRLYDKRAPVPARKMGHLCAVGDTIEEAIGRVTFAAEQLAPRRTASDASPAPRWPRRGQGSPWTGAVLTRAGALACALLLVAGACAPGGFAPRWVGTELAARTADGARAMPPTVAPLTVDITGPAPVVTPGTHAFRAHAAGGLGEYSYTWDAADGTAGFRATGVTDPVLVRDLAEGDVLHVRVTVRSGALRAVGVRRVESPAPIVSE